MSVGATLCPQSGVRQRNSDVAPAAVAFQRELSPGGRAQPAARALPRPPIAPAELLQLWLTLNSATAEQLLQVERLALGAGSQ